jgi:hypothetical protein
MPLLELVNALGFSFLLSEWMLHNKSLKLQLYAWAVILACNILLSEFVQSTFHYLIPAPAATFHGVVTGSSHFVSDLVGSSMLLTPVVLLICFIIVGKIRPQLLEKCAVTWKAGLLLSVCAVLVFIVLKFVILLDNDSSAFFLHHQHAFRVFLAMSGFLILCYCDVKRLAPDTTLAEFGSSVAFALAYVGPMIPFIAIAISTAFMVALSLLEWVGIDPHILNSAIFYGTIYGPFAFVYWEVKKKCFAMHGVLGGSILPSTTAHRSKKKKAMLKNGVLNWA